ncbi:MAG: hypothetical protein J6X66_01835 [Lachnospiraceae bacterium]|nr:hypothetical protein [Lachnospiraceae bacterium]
MDLNYLTIIKEYPDVYEDVVEKGIRSLADYKEHLKTERNMTTGTLSRRVSLVSGEAPFLSCNDDEIIIDKKGAISFISQLAQMIGLTWDREVIFPDSKVDDLKTENEDLRSKNQEYAQKIARQEEHISNLKAKLDERMKNELKSELERKVIIASSINVGPVMNTTDTVFTDDPENVLNVEKCVARFGGEIDSFYNEIPDDKEDTGYEPGHKFSLKNHLLSIMKRIGTEGLFKKRIKESADIKEAEARVGKLFPGHYDNLDEQQKERHNFIRNRYKSLNKVMANCNLTNQEKLMLYGLNSIYHDTNFEKLLLYAGRHCINAHYLIEILEDPDTGYNYENTLAFLEQFAEPSEFRMKLDLARDLIVGKWYITAEYNGRETKFQLVPIDEFNELRQAAGLPISEFGYKGDKGDNKAAVSEEADAGKDNNKPAASEETDVKKDDTASDDGN